MCGGLVSCRLYGFIITSVRKTQDGLICIALVEALAGRFVLFGENDYNPRAIQRGQMGGPGKGYGER